MKQHIIINLSNEEKHLFESWQHSDKIPSNLAIRAQIILLLSQGKSVSEVAQTCDISRGNAYKWFHRYKPLDHKWYLDHSRCPKNSPSKTPKEIEETVKFVFRSLEMSSSKGSPRAIKHELEELHVTDIPSISTIYRILKRHNLHSDIPKTGNKKAKHNKNNLQNRNVSRYRRHKRKQNIAFTVNLSICEKDALESWRRSTMTKSGLVKRSEIILLAAADKHITEIADILNVSRTMAYKWIKRFQKNRLEGLYRRKPNITKKYEDESVKSAVFAVLHSPPTDYNFNRTSWKLDDLKQCLSENGIYISKGYIRKIIRSAGYSWRKARVVLTSPDPDYRKKLIKIQSILSKLKDDEHFFSIDEFGPFAIKMHGGRKLIAPNENFYVHQYQKSKGFLIITAALELSTNQITHFYSRKKNTDEMIKLLDLLLIQHKNCRRIYLSWDAASWHASKALYKRVKQINRYYYRRNHLTPIVRLVPLPKSAQFLNVIESVFSGMARAIIHNSNYESKEATKDAIDRYFKERNDYFKRYPQKAGKKIWGEELVPSTFSESQNCKDPKW
jgi:transposase